MKIRSHCGVFGTTLLAALLTDTVVLAQSASQSPFDGVHNSQYAYFSHWSAIIPQGPDRVDLEYAICNLSEHTSLIYSWNGPNITVGKGGRLPSRKCHIVNRQAAEAVADHGAHILYTQASRAHSAPTYVSALPDGVPWNLLPRALTHRIRGFFGAESTETEASLADLVMQQSRSDVGASVRYHITWFPAPKVAVVLPDSAFDGIDAEMVSAQLQEQGHSVSRMTFREALFESEGDTFTEERLNESVLFVERNLDSQAPLIIEYGGVPNGLLASHVTLVDVEHRLMILDTEINIYRMAGL